MDPAALVPLGRTGLRVTRVGLGTAPLGGLFEAVGDSAAHAVVERAYVLGIRFFDTAPLYGCGLAEMRLGHVLRRKPRGEFVVATKVGRLLRPGAPPDPAQPFWRERVVRDGLPVHPVFDFSYDGVMRSVEESLGCLGLDRVDILHIHDPDDHFEEALSGAYRALDRLRREGTVRAIGVGMNQVEMLVEFARRASVDCVLVAGRYTLLDCSALRELLPLCRDRGIAVIAGGVFNSGILASPRPGATYDYRPAPPAVLDRARRLEAFCARHGVPLLAAAMQFPLGHPAVAAVLLGCRSVEELEEDLRLFRVEIPAALWEDLRGAGLLPGDAPVPGETSRAG